MSNVSIKAVVFDHGGVLTRGGEKGTNEKAASRAMGLDYVINIPDLNEELKRGEISNQEWVAQINRRYQDSPRRLTMEVWDSIYDELTPDVDAYAFAERCRQAGLATGILSSVNQSIADKLYADGSYLHFAPVLLSCEHGLAKPDPKIYQLMHGWLNVGDPAKVLFLDDQEKCCVGARAIGWQAIRVDSTEQMIRDASEALGLDASRVRPFCGNE